MKTIMISRSRSLIVRLALHFFLLHATASWFRDAGQSNVAVKAFSVVAKTTSKKAPQPSTTSSTRTVAALVSSSSSTRADAVLGHGREKIITGPMGRPASSREEDLRLTIQVIQDFHKLLVEEKQDEDDDVIVVSDVKIQEKVAVFSEDKSSSEDEATTTTTKVPEEEAVRNILGQVEEPAAELLISSAIPIEYDDSIVDDNKEIFDELMETLSRPAFKGPLTRLAAAFGQGLHPSRIASTSVISLSLTQIEIGALVCEDGVCINVAVPVPFSKPCSNNVSISNNGGVDALEKCILDAIDELDVLATQRIEASERALVNSEQISWEKGLFQELQDDGITPVFPDWWTEPIGNWELQDECATLKRLLNEDEFQMERHALVKQQLQQLQQHLQGTVTQAAVAFVGTNGLLLRANLESTKDVDSTTTTTNRIVDLPLHFLKGTAEARTVDDLRAAVLDLVDSVTDR